MWFCLFPEESRDPRLKPWVRAVGWPPTDKSVGWRGIRGDTKATITAALMTRIKRIYADFDPAFGVIG